MSFRGRVARMFRSVRADGSTAVDVGAYSPRDGVTSYTSAVTLWAADGDTYLALIFDDGPGGNGRLGIGSKAANTYTPTVQLYAGGGAGLYGTGTAPAFLDFTTTTTTDDGAGHIVKSTRKGATVVRPDSLETATVTAPANGSPLTLDGRGNPIQVTGTLAGAGIVRPALGSGWSNYGAGGYAPFGYRQLPDGSVRFEGMIAGGLTGAANPVITLPAALRPAAHHQFITAASGGLADVRIFSTGVVSVYAFQAGGTNASVSFAGVEITPAGIA